ncbi:hypothetical protein U1Q18_052698 [Sarracenia purpurea var. burkii]
MANVMEYGNSSGGKKSTNDRRAHSRSDKRDGQKKDNLRPRGRIAKKQKEKFQGKCFNCDKFGHRASECKKPKNPQAQAHMAEAAADAMHIDLSAMVSEVNLIGSNPQEWWIDTGATRHVCCDRLMFSTLELVTHGQKLYMGNSATSDVLGQGQVILKMTSGKELTLNNVLYVPDIRKNLISGSLLSKHGFRMVFEADRVTLTKAGLYVGKGYMTDGLFKMNVMTVIPKANKMKNPVAYVLESSILWHGRLGHVNYDSMRRLINLDHIPSFDIDKSHKCETCVEAKLTRSSFHLVERSTEPLGLIHTDVCDLKYVQTPSANKYFITFIDDSTKYCYVYLLKSKDEALDKFILYKNEVENQLSKRIKVLRSDRGGEYESPFGGYCAEHGIIYQTTAPYSPQQNGTAERKNRTLKDMMNAMLVSSGLPQNMWGEAVLTANHILNLVPRKKTDKTPFELFKGRRPTYNHLRTWGCLAKVAIPPPKKEKIGPKTVDCVFIGYAQNSSAYRCLVYESAISDIHKNTVMESRNVSFFEHIFPYRSIKESSSVKRTLHPANDSSRDQEEEVDIEPRRSKRARKSTSFGPDFLTYLVENEPRTYQEAVSCPEAPLWKEAIKSEIDSILQNHTWELVDLPQGSKPLGYKWIFKRKMKADGSIDKYKARLVIKGYRQKEGLDYFDTYSPVSRITSIRMITAIAALRNLAIHQMDVKTAFLNGDLDEEIYMEQPEGFSGPKGKVCRLVRSLYGLKQAPKQWHEKFDSVVLSHGFRINECDKCVYVKDTDEGYVLLCLYVDDMLIVGSNDKVIQSTKDMLNSKFDMKDMGLANVILGVQITRTSDGLMLSQSHYVDKILRKFSNSDTKVAWTPVDLSLQLSKNGGESVSQLEYSQVIGSLMYLMSCTRPDIAYSVSRLSRYTSNPGHDHWKAIVRLLRYLRYTRDLGLHYTRYPAVLEGYCDANWISDTKDSKSTSGYVFLLGGAAVSWKSSKQTCIARSTMESEFIALDKATEEAEWLRQFLEDVPRWPRPVPAICIHCDSQSAIGRAQSHMYNGKSRHIRRRHNTIRKLLSSGVVTIDYVKSKDNIADPLTKGLTRELVERASMGMGLKPIK